MKSACCFFSGVPTNFDAAFRVGTRLSFIGDGDGLSLMALRLDEGESAKDPCFCGLLMSLSMPWPVDRRLCEEVSPRCKRSLTAFELGGLLLPVLERLGIFPTLASTRGFCLVVSFGGSGLRCEPESCKASDTAFFCTLMLSRLLSLIVARMSFAVLAPFTSKKLSPQQTSFVGFEVFHSFIKPLSAMEVISSVSKFKSMPSGMVWSCERSMRICNTPGVSCVVFMSRSIVSSASGSALMARLGFNELPPDTSVTVIVGRLDGSSASSATSCPFSSAPGLLELSIPAPMVGTLSS
mmetsp:Transcript_79088/g.124857  ORF Transcript_79088/g.124857 Transcript_79088/m.124857 type:complete len:295 (-) Transcript_79088:120-1004(-)